MSDVIHTRLGEGRRVAIPAVLCQRYGLKPGDACISAVNLCEVIGKLLEYHRPLAEITFQIDRLQLGVIPFDGELAHLAASLRPATRATGLSLGDLACRALARQAALPALTTEKQWLACDIGVKVVKIR